MEKKLTLTIDGVKHTLPKINVKTYYLLSEMNEDENPTVEQKSAMILDAFGIDMDTNELIEKADPCEFDTAALAIPRMVLDIMNKTAEALIELLGNAKAPKEES